MNLVVVSLAGLALLVGCSNKPKQESTTGTEQQTSAVAPVESAPTTPDTMTAELSKLAGKDATDCGRVGVKGDVTQASDCAIQAFKTKKPFYVRYDLPVPDSQMSVATALGADGVLYTVQYDSNGWVKAPEDGKISADKKVSSSACPKPETLRVANSGRVTCYPPAQMPGGMSPHGGGDMRMPPATGPNPHATGGSTQKSH